MTGVYGSRRSMLPNVEDVDSTRKFRERRRRRIEMRKRLELSQKFVTEHEKTELSMDEETVSLPVYGSISVVGRAREMEDEISVHLNFCSPEINGFRPVHYFGVFDGHGGHQVSTLCKENMHVILQEELMRVQPTAAEKSTAIVGGELEKLWRIAISRSFERIDNMAMTLCHCPGPENFKVCQYHPQLSLVGSTAVVSLLTDEYIIVANCGDSRAVLSRNGKAVPLSVDHKPDREDERARIEALGGRIFFTGNSARVEGVLAMSRAIGDRFLKQVVSSEPEYLFMKREAVDMSLILASDGLWDVLSNELSCEVVNKCQQEDQTGNLAIVAQREMTAAAVLLVRLAMGRRSTDNISVVVVDLRK